MATRLSASVVTFATARRGSAGRKAAPLDSPSICGRTFFTCRERNRSGVAPRFRENMEE